MNKLLLSEVKLSIIIPCYDEERTIKQIIERVEEAGAVNKEIIVIDDGSKDRSQEILMELMKTKPHLKVYLRKDNRGKGATVREGFSYSTGDYVIVQDGDLEYDPRDYTKLLAELDKGAQVVYGSRFSGNYEDMTSMHYLGNRFLTFLTNVLYGTHLSDMETCYKLIPGDFARSLKLTSDRFDFEPEITSKILKSGMKIVEVPISYKGRSWKDGKKITWRDGLHAVKTLIKFRFFE